MIPSFMLSSEQQTLQLRIGVFALVAILACIGLEPVHAQPSVALTLQDTDGAPLPDSTVVAVIVEEGSRAQSLMDMRMPAPQQRADALLEQAFTSPEARFGYLDSEGTTRTLRLPGGPTSQTLAYVIAQTPDSTLYHSRVGGSRVSDGPGFDLVVSGSITVERVRPGEQALLREALADAERVATTAQITLRDEDESLPEGTAVRLWYHENPDDAIDLSALAEYPPDLKTTLNADGRTIDRALRSWYAQAHAFVAAQPPGNDDPPRILTSQSDGQQTFVTIETSPHTLTALPDSAAATLAPAFEEQVGWGRTLLSILQRILIGILVGLAIVFGGIAALRWYKRKHTPRKNRFVK